MPSQPVEVGLARHSRCGDGGKIRKPIFMLDAYLSHSSAGRRTASQSVCSDLEKGLGKESQPIPSDISPTNFRNIKGNLK
jgi:hypothetical protein